MRAVAVAAAGAAILGSVSAASHAQHVHAKLHARDSSWADWEATSASTTPSVAIKTTTTTTAGSVDPTWADWESTTTVTLKSTVTTTKYVAPVTSVADETWADWDSSVASTTSKPALSVVTSIVQAGWSSAGWFGPSWSVEAGQCAVSIITSYGPPTWYPDSSVASTTASSTGFTWEDWASTTSSVPVVPTTTSTTVSTTTSKPASTSDYTWQDWTSTTTSSVPIVPVTTTTTANGGWGVPSSPASSSSSKTGSSSTPSGSSYPGIKPNGNSWGMTYSPYTAQGGCKDAASVAKDLALIAAKGFSTVRVYSTDCNTLENIGKSARDNGLKLIIGVWINASGFTAAKGQVDDIVKWAQWDIVELIVVGNEVVFNGLFSASDLAGFISSSTWSFKNAGYTGPVTTTEPLSVWEDTKNSAVLGPVIDVVGANLYAFFNAQISADKAGSFIQAQINILNGIFSGKSVYVLESGWPHAGNANGAAVPSPENQAIALKGIQSAVGAQVVFLSFEDEPWKEPGQFGVEPYWGCASVF